MSPDIPRGLQESWSTQRAVNHVHWIRLAEREQGRRRVRHGASPTITQASCRTPRDTGSTRMLFRRPLGSGENPHAAASSRQRNRHTRRTVLVVAAALLLLVGLALADQVAVEIGPNTWLAFLERRLEA